MRYSEDYQYCLITFNLISMDNKLDRLATEWANTNKDATLTEAYKAGYLRCTEAWVNQES